jgi:hypothetical protein
MFLYFPGYEHVQLRGTDKWTRVQSNVMTKTTHTPNLRKIQLGALGFLAKQPGILEHTAECERKSDYVHSLDITINSNFK